MMMTEAFLKEHGEVIIQENAVKVLKNLAKNKGAS
jgi:negative regulator of genetic competence, sporulation and motility